MKKPNKQQIDHLLSTLQERFLKNRQRHPDLQWEAVTKRLNAEPEKLVSLLAMEETGGEPDVIGQDKKTGILTFADCADESPKGRRSICYDKEALDARKENKPRHSALGMAAEMGIELLDEKEYRHLQTLGTFDAKTSSWVLTPSNIRSKGGALFCDLRFGHVFVYHNGAESYYAARGFRGKILI